MELVIDEELKKGNDDDELQSGADRFTMFASDHLKHSTRLYIDLSLHCWLKHTKVGSLHLTLQQC